MDEEHHKQHIAVIGASGFIGRNILDWARQNNGGNFIWVYFNSPVAEPNAVPFETFLEAGHVHECKSVICVAGNSDHGLAERDFLGAIRKDSSYLVELLGCGYKGSIVLLSSAAVYYGYEGPVTEEAPVAPTIKYGISKYVAELLVRSHALTHGVRSVIFRLMYAFGPHEKKRRLIPALCESIRNSSPITIAGNGNSFLNPLPASFVAEVLARTALEIDLLPLHEPLAILNLASPAVLRVRDIVENVQGHFPLEVKYVPEEHQPVAFYAATEKLLSLTEHMGLRIPDPLASVHEYVQALLRNSTLPNTP